MLAAGQTAAEAARLAAESAETARSRREAQLEQQDAPGLGLRSAAAQREAETVEALARLEARLGGVEGSLGGLEVAQGEALRRMSAAVDAAVGEAGDLISSEVRAGMEPLRRLPSLLASALPPGELVSGEGLVPGAVGEARLLPEPVALSEVQLRELRADVARELGGAVERLGGGVTASDEQWEAVGRRLGSIEESIAQAAAARAPPMQSDFDGFAEEVQKAVEAVKEANEKTAVSIAEIKEEMNKYVRWVTEQLKTTHEDDLGTHNLISEQVAEVVKKAIEAHDQETENSDRKQMKEILDMGNIPLNNFVFLNLQNICLH